MKVTIVGAGAIGGWVGTRIARNGHDVSAVARGATAAALREHGFRLQDAQGTVTVPVRVAENAHDLGAQDLVVVAVKGPAMAGAAESVAALLGPDTMVLTAMNGIPWWFFHGLGGAQEGTALESVDPGGAIATAISSQHVVGCVVHASCATPEPGLVRHNFGNGLIVGEPCGGESSRAEALTRMLGDAGFEVTLSQRIQSDIWYKLWGNMTMNPVSALTGATMNRILADPLLEAFALSVMREAAAVGAKIGCAVMQSGEDRNAITRKLGAVKTSMLQDVEARRAVEIDALLAAPREIAQKVGVPTPNLDALLGVVRLFARTRGLYPDVPA